jgi:hypothetical protein
MPPNLFPGLQDESDDDFNVIGGDIYATFSPWASWMSVGNPFGIAPLMSFPSLASAGAAVADGQTDPGSVVAVTSGGITINLIFDAAALAAPASFRAGIQQAAAILTASISDKITVNLKIDYSGTGGGAAAGPDHGLFESYSSIRADLINNATPGDATFNALAAGSSIQGQSNVVVWNGQLKLWGLMAANDTTTDDGSATFATDINSNLLVGVALHELTHALGRVPYGSQPDVFDFFRFTSPGTRLFLNGATAPAAYFSTDGGNAKLADYGQTSDPSDFLNSGVQGGNDPFDEFYNGSTAQQLTAVDLKQLDALGFHMMSKSDTVAPSLVHAASISIAVGATQTITSSNLQFDDNVSAHAQETYTIVTAPAHGALLKSGLATSSFTQTDIDNGSITYHESDRGVTSDFFAFRVTDSAGNQTTTQSLQFQISTAAANDFNGDGLSDLLWWHGDGTFTEWQSTGNGFTPNVVVASIGTANSWHPEGSFDFSGDGKADLLWRNDASGQFTIWDSTGNGFTPNSFVINGVDATWKVAALADFNGDGESDILFRNNSGTFTEWQSTGTGFTPNVTVNSSLDSTWHLTAAADFSGDHKADLLFRNNNGTFTEWQSTGNGFTPNAVVNSTVDPTWHVLGTGDFNGDGKTDLLWRNDNGTFTEWQSTGAGFTPNVAVVSSVDNSWHLAQVGDFNSDGKDDLLWRNDNGTFTEWQSTGNSFTPNVVVSNTVGTDWTLVTHHYDLV